MAGGMYLCLIIFTLVLLGFSYIIWVLASKEAGWIKLGGQILAILLKISVLLMFIIAILYCKTFIRIHKACYMMPGMMKPYKMEMMMPGMKDKMGGKMMMEKGKMKECPRLPKGVK
jgi:predicted permease